MEREPNVNTAYCYDKRHGQQTETGCCSGRKQTTINTLKFWRDKKSTYPTLAIVARKVLAISPGSAESERLFSEESLVVNARRNRLLPETAEQLLFVSRNLGISL